MCVFVCVCVCVCVRGHFDTNQQHRCSAVFVVFAVPAIPAMAAPNKIPAAVKDLLTNLCQRPAVTADAAAAVVAAVSVAALGIVVPGDTATMQATTPPPPQMVPDDPHEEMCKGDDQGQGQKVVKDKGEDKGEKMLDKGELRDDQEKMTENDDQGEEDVMPWTANGFFLDDGSLRSQSPHWES